MKSILKLFPKEMLIQLGLEILLNALNEKPDGKLSKFIKEPKLLKTIKDIAEKLETIQNNA